MHVGRGFAKYKTEWPKMVQTKTSRIFASKAQYKKVKKKHCCNHKSRSDFTVMKRGLGKNKLNASERQILL